MGILKKVTRSLKIGNTWTLDLACGHSVQSNMGHAYTDCPICTEKMEDEVDQFNEKWEALRGLHVDEFIENTSNVLTQDDDLGNINYARWMLMHFRLPAAMLYAFQPWLRDHKLFCTYAGTRYRVTGASRMGDIYLTKDYNKEVGYDIRVGVAHCKHWGEIA